MKKFGKFGFYLILYTLVVGALARFLYPIKRETVITNSRTVVKHDTSLVEVVKVLKDTTLNWRERIAWKEVKPESVIWYPKIIPVEVWGKWPEMIFLLAYDKKQLGFYSMTSDTTIRYYTIKVPKYHSGFFVKAKGDGFIQGFKRQFGEWPSVKLGIFAESDGITGNVRYSPDLVIEGRLWRFYPWASASINSWRLGIRAEIWRF